MSYFKDKDIEEAMLKSCLLFNSKEIKNKRNVIFQKFLLSLIIGGGVANRKGILEKVTTQYKGYLINENNIDFAIQELIKNKFIKEENGELALTVESQQDMEKDVKLISEQQKHLIDDISKMVQRAYGKKISNENQVKSNIKDCIDYYYVITGLSFFELDKRKEATELPQLGKIASNGLSSGEKEELSNQIIYTIGSVIEKPTEEQKCILELLARTYITMQIMDIDPLLSEFKSTLIREKVFIVDTDVLLYLLTDNASLSKQYRKMIEMLQKCGCTIYIPEEVIKEVFNHAEAALKRYPFVSYLIDTPGNLVRQDLKNVFIEDYYYTRTLDNVKYLTWEHYIKNYYSSTYGVSLISEQIKDKLGERIQYNTMPEESNIDDKLLKKLAEASLEETYKTEKAQHRDEDKNQDIAKTDAQLYLQIKKQNEINNERIGRKDVDRQDLLWNKYYILTNSTRVHYCAKQLGVSANILCKPASLMAYLVETGLVQDNQLKIQSLFENPFLQHTAKTIWKDVENLLKLGIDIKGKNIITMRFELQDEINNLLTNPTEEDCNDIYSHVKQKGYSFLPLIESAKKESESYERKYKELEEENRILQDELLKTKQIIEKKDKVIKKNKYENRKKLKKRNSKKK
jgi:hypothetical protein